MTFGSKPGEIDKDWLVLVNLNPINDTYIPSNQPNQTIGFSPEWGGTTRLVYTDVLVVKEIDYGN